jgi:DNA-binding MarR family transcriptional regulator
MSGRRTQAPPGKTLVADARRAVATCAGLNIRLAARRISAFLDQRLQATGLTTAQFGLLTHIAAAGDDTLGALAERAGLDQSTLSRNLRGLEQAGLVEIAIVEKDMRRRSVWLTEQGARRLEAAMPAWRRAQDALSAAIRPRDVEALATASAALGQSTASIETERRGRRKISASDQAY